MVLLGKDGAEHRHAVRTLDSRSEAVQLLDQIRSDIVCDLLLTPVAHERECCGRELRLAFVAPVDRALRHARLRGNGVHRHARVPVTRHQAQSRLEDRLVVTRRQRASRSRRIVREWIIYDTVPFGIVIDITQCIERIAWTPTPRQYDYFTRRFVELFAVIAPFTEIERDLREQIGDSAPPPAAVPQNGYLW